jgi:UDP-4-amino-4,6-dideoxy-N-acetyl-beta-L-altrosamine N-acetyltransferase
MLARLLPLTREHIEIIRNWRNQEHVREIMEYREIISPTEQENWFEQLKDSENKYFVFVDRDDEYVGLINLKNITLDCAESGLFVGNPNYLGTGIAYSASIALLNIAFSELKLKNVVAKVNVNNVEAIRYNETLGFKIKAKLNKEFVQMEIDEENFNRRSKIILKVIN